MVLFAQEIHLSLLSLSLRLLSLSDMNPAECKWLSDGQQCCMFVTLKASGYVIRSVSISPFWHQFRFCLLWRTRPLWSLKASPSERPSRCSMWRSSLWSISWLRHQMFYPYVTISGTQACESDDLSPFPCFLSSFSGMQWILGYVKMRRIAAVHPPKKGRRRSICRSLRIGTTFTQRCDIIGLQTLVRRMQTLNWDRATEGVRKEPEVFVPHFLVWTTTRPSANFHPDPSKYLSTVDIHEEVWRFSVWAVEKRQQIQLLWT